MTQSLREQLPKTNKTETKPNHSVKPFHTMIYKPFAATNIKILHKNCIALKIKHCLKSNESTQKHDEWVFKVSMIIFMFAKGVLLNNSKQKFLKPFPIFKHNFQGPRYNFLLERAIGKPCD